MSELHVVATDATTLHLDRLLPGPIDRVWSFLVDDALRARWLAGGPIEPRVGGAVRLRFHNNALTGQPGDLPPPKYGSAGGPFELRGTVTACEPPHLLAYTWNEDSEAPSHVRFELAPAGNQVRLRITHSRVASADGRLSFAAGWQAHVEILAARLAGAEPGPFWARHSALEAAYEGRT
jgi:uncharacterized protein YndB with AHSA1/START domain